MPRGLFGLRVSTILGGSYGTVIPNPRALEHFNINGLPLYVNPRDLIIEPSVLASASASRESPSISGDGERHFPTQSAITPFATTSPICSDIDREPILQSSTTACPAYGIATNPQSQPEGTVNYLSLHLPAQATTTASISASEASRSQSVPDTDELFNESPGSSTQDPSASLRAEFNCQTCNKPFLRRTELKYVLKSNPFTLFLVELVKPGI